MADLRVNGNNDIDWDKLVLTTDNTQSVAQKVKLRLLRYLGEYFLNISVGIPYLQEITRKGISKEYVDTIFIDEIIATVGIVSLDSYESVLTPQGVYQAVFVATTVEGVTFQFNIQPIALN